MHHKCIQMNIPVLNRDKSVVETQLCIMQYLKLYKKSFFFSDYNNIHIGNTSYLLIHL